MLIRLVMYTRIEVARMDENLQMPKHVAIILDGNGRWSKAKGLPRN